MKKAFTLIELLVVIAIIAILAAILFPVFAQAKVAAKKTAALSNQKQIALGLLMYTADYDDLWPRQDGCVNNSSLNPARNNGVAGTCAPAVAGVVNGVNVEIRTGSDPFAYGVNHFAWQKWVLPYIKSVDLFFHPGKGLINVGNSWSSNGQIQGSFALNIAVTGALFTRSSATSLALGNNVRNSFWGGATTGSPNPAAQMLLMETSNPNSAAIPMLADETIFSTSHLGTATNYPWAIRETWMREFYKWSDACTNSTPFTTTASVVNTSQSNVNTSRVFGNGIQCGFVDGHAKFVNVAEFLSKTPTAAEYVQTPATSFGGRCGLPGASGNFTGAAPNMNVNYPFWGLGSN